MGHFISRKKTFLFKVTLAAALPILFVAEPTYAAGISSSHIETKTETKERIKKREKKAKRNRVIKIKDQDYFTKSYPSSINTVTKEISKKTIKKKYLKKGKKKVRITIKTVTTVKTISDETQLNQKITTLSDMQKYLPKEIYNSFISRGFSFSLVDKSEISNASGFFSARKRCIKLAIGHNTLSTALHEFGHFVSFISGNTALRPSFQNVYQAEKGLYTGGTYGISSASEYFAESFKEYIANPEILKQSRPMTYSMIDQAVQQVIH